MKLAVVASHPVQYYAPLFRELSSQIDLVVFYAHNPSPQQQSDAGFGTAFEWDVDLLSGYNFHFLINKSSKPNTSAFRGCDTPEVGSHLVREKFDAVLVMGWHLMCFWQALIACKLHGIPILVRGDSQLSTPRRPLWNTAKEYVYPHLLRLFDGILYVGANNKEYLDHYRYPPERQFYSPHCVDVDWFRKHAGSTVRAAMRSSLGIPEGFVNILFAGRLVEFKRPGDVLLAASLLQKHIPVCVTIAGSGELEESLKELAQRHSLRIHYLGFCNQSQMPAVYACADVLVLPSSGRETWGLVCNEALACGTPIVVSDEVGCAPDVMTFDKIAKNFPIGDVDALAEAIWSVSRDGRKEELFTEANEKFSPKSASTGVIKAVRSVSR